jgi:L-methionine (R)-S-oxide reductase
MNISKILLFNSLTEKTKDIVRSKINRVDKLKAVCNLLQNNCSYYNWVGFYAVDKERSNELVLVSFEGEPTEHVRITFGKGICGQAALIGKTVVVQNVSKETNYLSCSPKVKSEIVIPIFRNKEIVGELDIDSHVDSVFTQEDLAFLEDIAKLVSRLF